MATLAAQDGTDNLTSAWGAQRRETRRLILSDLAFEVGHEIEQEADQAKGGFGAIEGLQAKTVSAEVLFELLDAILALGAAVVETPGRHRVVPERGHQHWILFDSSLRIWPLLTAKRFRQTRGH
jgi:hypothetical protein